MSKFHSENKEVVKEHHDIKEHHSHVSAVIHVVLNVVTRNKCKVHENVIKNVHKMEY